MALTLAQLADAMQKQMKKYTEERLASPNEDIYFRRLVEQRVDQLTVPLTWDMDIRRVLHQDEGTEVDFNE